MKIQLLKSAVSLITITAFLSACSLSDIVDTDKPQIDSEIDHDYFDTRTGALSLLYSTQGSLQAAVSATSLAVGVFTDELTARPYNSMDNVYFGTRTNHDPRVEYDLIPGVKGIEFPAYVNLQASRARADYARYFLRRQADSSLNYAISAAYSFEGYAITMLAENLCSGVPLSQAPYGQDAVYGRALSTDSLISIAVSKFDSALAIQHDSLRFKTLARIGKARALMSVARYADAAAAASQVEPGDVFNLRYTETITPGPVGSNPIIKDAFWTQVSGLVRTNDTGHEIVNREGGNGLIWYIDANAVDPRLTVTTVADGDSLIFPSVVRQRKFLDGSVTFPIAGWVEAKMIEAEHLLNANDPNWIDPINEARQSVGLSDTTSPSNAAQKVNLLFRERAFWFYGHGTRLSDIRRLVRQYSRSVNSVYPIGIYSRAALVYTYGDATAFIPSLAEYENNYNYSGCLNRNA